ncbi:MAG TPA: polysaccharide biosynthesis C-terminal domain-containing protein [Pirellulales bacterium]|nr:polysaccharide biosynthesis C-terminal domain-containing protein [Pirellulales bacterium]
MAMLDQGIVSGASFATSVMVGRFCGEEALGLYALGFTLLILIRGVQESLVLTPYTIFVARLPGRRRPSYSGSALAHSAAAAFVSMLVLGGCGLALSASLRFSGFAPVVWMLTATLPLLLLREVARRFSFAELQLGRAVRIDAVAAGCQLLLLAWLAVAGRLSAATALAAMGVACGASGAVWLVRSGRRHAIHRRRVVRDWRRNWSLGRWIFAEQMCGTANSYSLHWLLALLLGAAATGEFAAAATVVSLTNPMIIGLGNLLGPATAGAYATGGVPEMERVVETFTWRMAGLMLLVCLAIAGFGNSALALLYGPSYANHGAALTLLALALAANALGMGADSGLRAMGRPRETFYASLLALLVTICAGGCLTPAWNVIGAACAVLAGNVAGAARAAGAIA